MENILLKTDKYEGEFVVFNNLEEKKILLHSKDEDYLYKELNSLNIESPYIV